MQDTFSKDKLHTGDRRLKVVSMNGQEEEPVNAKVKSLIVYPVKSFRGVTLKKAIITERGLAVPNLNDNLSIDRE